MMKDDNNKKVQLQAPNTGFGEEQAIEVLVQAVEIGRKAGVYSFKDSNLIYQAITVLGEKYGANKKK